MIVNFMNFLVALLFQAAILALIALIGVTIAWIFIRFFKNL